MNRRRTAMFCLPAAALLGQGMERSQAALATAPERLLSPIIMSGLAMAAIAAYITVRMTREIAGRRRAEEALSQSKVELEQARQQLLETSKKADMGEIATDILHNVGNVLNSANTSASMAVGIAKNSNADDLAKVAAMLREHERDLGAFLTADPKGKQLPAYLNRLSDRFLAAQKTIVQELDSLRDNILHMMEIVATQQNYAKVPAAAEPVNIRELVEDSLRIHVDAMDRQSVKIVREFETVPPARADKHKVLQILVNLLRNARRACDDSPRADKQLTVRVVPAADRILVSVADNGAGIPPENLSRIFNRGFTTRKDGHGFGLHASALAAREMGGSLSVHSDGPGLGATFTLELPAAAKENANE